ncbi:hypothetical protein MKK63_11030 [Methylobacterium sp. J-088]|uniref:hypothetical protein n=1 Tax=Methylobacterium sp. J-088 TaxID=2836664 RepID=UPI001FB96524|nr:hypothetical protein [Methylobacterium sp. J-088]MCJ2063243.1 hypothetical protein [Methylobacterium sp. J-088]
MQFGANSPSRTRWLETIAFAPDDYRASHGLTVGLDPATRQSGLDSLINEMPYLPAGSDYLDIGRSQPHRYSGNAPALAPLGQSSPPASFLQQNNDLLLGQDINASLNGQPTRGADPVGDALAALFAPQPRILGGY